MAQNLDEGKFWIQSFSGPFGFSWHYVHEFSVMSSSEKKPLILKSVGIAYWFNSKLLRSYTWDWRKSPLYTQLENNGEIWGAIERKINNCYITFSLVVSNFKFGSSSKSRYPPSTHKNIYQWLQNSYRDTYISSHTCWYAFSYTYTDVYTDI